MKDLKQTFSDKAVYLKIIVLVLCLFAVVIWSCYPPNWFSSQGLLTSTTPGMVYNYGQYFEMMIVATAGYMIVMLLLVIIYIADDSDRIFELLFLLGGIVVNLGAGVWILIDTIRYEGNWVPYMLGGLMIGSGVVMIIDIIRAFKSD